MYVYTYKYTCVTYELANNSHKFTLILTLSLIQTDAQASWPTTRVKKGHELMGDNLGRDMGYLQAVSSGCQQCEMFINCHLFLFFFCQQKALVIRRILRLLQMCHPTIWGSFHLPNNVLTDILCLFLYFSLPLRKLRGAATSSK